MEDINPFNKSESYHAYVQFYFEAAIDDEVQVKVDLKN